MDFQSSCAPYVLDHRHAVARCSIETVSQMLGHTNIQTTQIYAKITNEKISRDMANLTERIGDKYKIETDRPASDFRNIGKVGKRKQSML